MATIISDLETLYQRQFGSKPYSVGNTTEAKDSSGQQSIYKISSNSNGGYGTDKLTTDSQGVEIWLPVWLEDLPDSVGENGELFLPYSVVRISGSSTIVRTPMAEQLGSVKELYNTEDYKINIKGFFIDKEQRLWPEKDLTALKKIHELGKAFTLKNALTDLFLSYKGLRGDEHKKVVITSFDLPEVQGGRKHVRPFVMTLESDSVFNLVVKDLKTVSV